MWYCSIYASIRLLNNEGSLLASAGEEHDIASAIFSNIWASFNKCDNSLEFLISEQEVRLARLVITTFKAQPKANQLTLILSSLVALVGGSSGSLQDYF